MLRRLARKSTPCLAVLALSLTALIPSTPTSAQVLYEEFAPRDEVVQIEGPWARYQTHVLRLRNNRYAVLFRPGFVDAATALNAISPLCAARGMQAALTDTIAPVALVLADGEDMVHQGFHIACVSKE